MEKIKEGLLFKSGRWFSAGGCIGIAPSPTYGCAHHPNIVIVYGYDGFIELQNEAGAHEYHLPSLAMTNEERKELSDYMVGLWTEFGNPISEEQQKELDNNS